jgi:hypothetical protein
MPFTRVDNAIRRSIVVPQLAKCWSGCLALVILEIADKWAQRKGKEKKRKEKEKEMAKENQLDDNS